MSTQPGTRSSQALGSRQKRGPDLQALRGALDARVLHLQDQGCQARDEGAARDREKREEGHPGRYLRIDAPEQSAVGPHEHAEESNGAAST